MSWLLLFVAAGGRGWWSVEFIQQRPQGPRSARAGLGRQAHQPSCARSGQDPFQDHDGGFLLRAAG